MSASSVPKTSMARTTTTTAHPRRPNAAALYRPM
jgi:hypothetical protein